MKVVLVLIVVTVCFFSCTKGQTSDVTNSTCPPEPTCPPVEACVCPPVTECPTTERSKTKRPGRTRTQECPNRTDGDRPGPGERSRPHTHGDRTRTDERMNKTRTDTNKTGPSGRKNRTRRPRPGGRKKPTRDCTPKLPPGCEDYVSTTGPMIFTTDTTTSPPPASVPSVCSSSVIDATGKREIPMIALQFYVSESNPFTFASEASDFAEVINLLAYESDGLDTVNTAVLGISAQENGLLVIVAVSFNTTEDKDYIQSSSQIVETLYGHLDQLGEYFHVTDMRTVRMVSQYYSPSSDSVKPETTTSSSTVAAITLSTLALIGMLGSAVVLIVKLIKKLSRQSNENQPLLEERSEEQRFTAM